MRGMKDNSELKTLFSKNKKNEKVDSEIIKPIEYNLINLNKSGYEILTKDKYIERRLCTVKPQNMSSDFVEMVHKHWEGISRGYGFVILVGDVHYNVDTFNEKILKVKRKKDISFDDLIKLNIKDSKVDFLYYEGKIIGVSITKEEEC